jgi:hypothetical protein
MDYCRYISLKITPTNQEFVADETHQIIIDGLQKLSVNYRFRLVEGLVRYYDCTAEISDAAFCQFTDCRYYRWWVANEIIVQRGFPAVVKAKKLNLAQFVRLAHALG